MNDNDIISEIENKADGGVDNLVQLNNDLSPVFKANIKNSNGAMRFNWSTMGKSSVAGLSALEDEFTYAIVAGRYLGVNTMTENNLMTIERDSDVVESIYFDQDNNYALSYVNTVNNVVADSMSATTIPASTEWFNVNVIRGNSKTKIYVNGVAENVIDNDGVLTTGITIEIGPFAGYMGEVLIWNRTLTLSELTQVNEYLDAKWTISSNPIESTAFLLAPPQNLVVTDYSTTFVDLGWSAVANADSYNIFRDAVLLTSSLTNSFTDNAVTAQQSYDYFVKAVNEEGESYQSNEVTITTEDIDAVAYIAAVGLSGGSVSIPQANAIQTFFANAKSSGIWTKIKRFYLPIWGNANANSIDLKTLTSGTFANSGTHASGYYESSGLPYNPYTRGYFVCNTDPVTQGITLGDAHMGMGVLNDVGGGSEMGGCDATDSNGLTVGDFGLGNDSIGRVSNILLLGTSSTASSHVIRSTISTTEHKLYVRRAAGFSTSKSISTTATVALVAVAPFFYGAKSLNGSPNYHSNSGRYVFAHYGLGLTLSEATDFSLYCKTMYEDVTGATMP